MLGWLIWRRCPMFADPLRSGAPRRNRQAVLFLSPSCPFVQADGALDIDFVALPDGRQRIDGPTKDHDTDELRLLPVPVPAQHPDVRFAALPDFMLGAFDDGGRKCDIDRRFGLS